MCAWTSSTAAPGAATTSTTYVTGRDAEVLPNPVPHRRRDMPPKPLCHSAPDGPEHASVNFAAGLSPDESLNPERSPPVKPCGHRNPCKCSVLRARLRIPEPPTPMAPPSPSPTLPAADDPPSTPTNGHQGAEPMKRAPLVAAKLEVAQARDRLAQERRRWPRASHASATAAVGRRVRLGSTPPRASVQHPTAPDAALALCGGATASRLSPRVLRTPTFPKNNRPPPTGPLDLLSTGPLDLLLLSKLRLWC